MITQLKYLLTKSFVRPLEENKMLALKARESQIKSLDWKVDDIGMVRQSINSMRDSRSPIFNQMVREHNQKIHDYRQGIKR